MNEAKLIVSRDVAIDLPPGRRRSSCSPDDGADPRIADLELAAQAEHGPDSVCRVVMTATSRCALDEVEALAPEHLVLLGEDAEALAPRVRNAGAVFVGQWSSVAAGDYATGGNHVLPTGGWARAVGGLGLETFLKPVTIQRLTEEGPRCRAADGRGARGRRGHASARRGSAAMRALSPGFSEYAWAPSTEEIARAVGARPVADRALRRQTSGRPPPCAPGAIARARRGQRYAHGGYPAGWTASRDYAGVDPENVVLGAGADDLILLCARAFAGPGDVVAGRARADVSALPHRGPARRRGGRRRRSRRHVLLPAEQPDGELGELPPPARSSSTRRTSSTRARPPSG